MRFDVIPLVEVNNVRFGMARDEVRRIWGSATEFLKTQEDKITTDDFGFCHVFYDSDNCCEAIELFSENEVYINGIKVFPVNFKLALIAVPSFIKDDDGLISYDLSIGIYAPDEENIESILFGKKNYFEL